MSHTRATLIKGFAWILCISFLVSCGSDSNVVSRFGKRKYRKGYYWHTAGEVDTRVGVGGDSALKSTYPILDKRERKDSIREAKAEQKEELREQKQIMRMRNDSIKALAKNTNYQPDTAAKVKKQRNKIKAPPEPPDDFTMRLLVMIVVLTGFSILTVGLITPIAIWGIAQNFLIIVGVGLSFVSLFISVNSKLGLNRARAGLDKQYNIGKPSLSLSLWAILPMAFLYACVKTTLIANLALVQVATIGLFVCGACVLLSLILGISALFVDDKHKPRARLAILIDALLIAAGILLFV